VAVAKSIRSFTREGGPLSEAALGDIARCLDVTPDGTIYGGARDHVEVFDPKGARKATWESLGEKATLTSIAAWQDGVYVADGGQRVVWRYDLAGKLVGDLGRKRSPDEAALFFVPSPYFDVAVSPEGLLYVANGGKHRIEAYSADGRLQSFWGQGSAAIEGFCGCCNPCNFALLPGGGFVTCEKGLPRVKIHDEKGVFRSVVAAPAKFVEGERGLHQDWRQSSEAGLDVAVDSQGRIIVLDPLGKRVRIFVKARKG